MRKLIFIWGICYILAACETPETTTTNPTDSTALNPNKTKVQVDTTMHKDTTRRDSLP